MLSRLVKILRRLWTGSGHSKRKAKGRSEERYKRTGGALGGMAVMRCFRSPYSLCSVLRRLT